MTELARHFGIDARLLLAQAVNFVILLIVLKKFAYDPIFRTLEARKREIEKGLAFTKQAERELQEIATKREATLNQARGEAVYIVGEAETLAKRRAIEIAAEAAKKGESLVAEAKKAIEEEKAKMGEAVFASAEDLIRTGLERVIGKLPVKERDEKLIREALGELRSAP